MQLNLTDPQFGTPHAGLVLISYWTVANPDDQRRAAAYAMDLWRETGWPDGMLSHHLFAGHDGHTVMNFSCWTGDAAFAAYLASDQPERARKIEAADVAITRDSIGRYRHYRTMPGSSSGARAGCYIAVTFGVPDAAAQTALVDRIILAAEGLERAGNHGDIASHFHLSESGTRVVNIAEFTDAESHARLIDGIMDGATPISEAIAGVPGASFMGFQRFDLADGAAAPVPHD